MQWRRLLNACMRVCGGWVGRCAERTGLDWTGLIPHPPRAHNIPYRSQTRETSVVFPEPGWPVTKQCRRRGGLGWGLGLGGMLCAGVRRRRARAGNVAVMVVAWTTASPNTTSNSSSSSGRDSVLPVSVGEWGAFVWLAIDAMAGRSGQSGQRPRAVLAGARSWRGRCPLGSSETSDAAAWAQFGHLLLVAWPPQARRRPIHASIGPT